MPDLNKLEALRGSGFNVMSCCLLCKNFTPGRGPIWGSCDATTFNHLKHTEEGKAASVPACGWCPSFKRDAGGLNLMAHEEFFHENEVKTTLFRFVFFASGWNIIDEYTILAETEEQARIILKKAIPLNSKAKYEDYTMSKSTDPEMVELAQEPGVINESWHGDDN